jgi:hypothetical protein
MAVRIEVMFFFHEELGLQRCERNGAHTQWIVSRFPDVNPKLVLRGVYWIDDLRKCVRILLYDNIAATSGQYRELTNQIALDRPGYQQTGLIAEAGDDGINLRSIRSVGLDLR